ncbi:MAG TPA: crotonase/enoyl-CoA hydratase family protein [Solimonas sp.]|nr:crotonase/enoyl-CoA hydratase family protein [Solimonas sp.]
MSELVRYELEGGIATLTMDDGKANALSPQMQAAINAALDRAEADKATVILTGRPGKFCAGFDLGIISAAGAPARDMLMGGFTLAARLLAYPRPVVIACSGHGLAMGAFLLLSGDYRIGVAGDFKIGANEVAIGMTMPWTAIEICRPRIANEYLNRVVINAEIFNPEGAVAAGFLDRVVPPEQLAAAARETALAMGKLNMAAFAATKQRLRAESLEAVKAGMERDDVGFREWLG